MAPDLGEEGLPLRALGLAGAGYLRREIERGEHRVIGLGHGRTLAAAVQQLPRLDAKGVRFVSLLGGLTRNYAANPYDVMHRLAERTAAQAYVMPVPFFANSVEDREVLLEQRGVREVFEMAKNASLKLVGIGTVDPQAQLVSSGMIEPGEIDEIAAGRRSRRAARPFLRRRGPDPGDDADRAGRSRPRSASRAATVWSRSPAARRRSRAIAAVLTSRRLTGLITDEPTAKALVGDA